MILVVTGLILMNAGTLRTLFEREFRMRLHTMGISDSAGAILVIVGIILEGFGVPKAILGLIFLTIWVPLITHTLAKAYTSRLRR